MGFEIYDWSKTFLLTFFPRSFPRLGPPGPVKEFVVVCILHHSTVLGTTIPMNLSYPSMAAYHQVGFSLLVSSGICYLAGQYKFTLDAKTEGGLARIKKIVLVQFIVNWIARIFLWFPLIYTTLHSFYLPAMCPSLWEALWRPWA
mmetsp:Transcript_89111/g.288157  ORF Transcript_89111/g.288157 Transcript_89111/m.288157 type:complete len:145 (-) Transcript_89111:411-845(-)